MAKSRGRKKRISGGTHYELSGMTSNSGIAVMGTNAKVTIDQRNGIRPDEMTAMFEVVFKQIEARPVNPDVDKEEIVEKVQKIQEEAKKEDKANPNKLERWLGDIAKMAPDILDVMLASLGGPVAGFSTVFKKIADKAKQGTESGG